jgi:two-component system alkaline phosphatase synthesis response regulator PhoP
VKILIVEDEPGLREGLVDLLRREGHTVEAVGDGEAALDRGSDPSIQMMLLDIMLPKLDGIEVCRRLREIRPELPILMLTARGAEDDKVTGLGAGADDYVTKPFSLKELIARVNALARRTSEPEIPALTIESDDCRIDLGRCEAVRACGERIPLTAREAAILRCLYQHRDRAVGRSELLEVVWGTRGDLRTRTVDMTIANLRQKVERDPSRPAIVVTVKGIGYAWGER